MTFLFDEYYWDEWYFYIIYDFLFEKRIWWDRCSPWWKTCQPYRLWSRGKTGLIFVVWEDRECCVYYPASGVWPFLHTGNEECKPINWPEGCNLTNLKKWIGIHCVRNVTQKLVLSVPLISFKYFCDDLFINFIHFLLAIHCDICNFIKIVVGWWVL